MKIKKIVSLIMLMLILCTSVIFAGKDDGTQKLTDAAWKVTDAILWVGYVVALGMVVFIGIKYITGAADAKADMKSAVVKYLIGAFIVFSATTIARFVVRIAMNGEAGDLASSIVTSAENAANKVGTN